MNLSCGCYLQSADHLFCFYCVKHYVNFMLIVSL